LGYGTCTQVNAPSAETCGANQSPNGQDEDCDGEVDETCKCVPGAIVASCHTNMAGACSWGVMRCASDGTGATGFCEPQTFPSAETCGPSGTGNGVDEDCDWATDEICVCQPPATEQCDTGLYGVCRRGTQTCINSGNGTKWGLCLENTGPSAETCGDGLDNDCDGIVDNGCPGGSQASCTEVKPEICGNGVDDNCSGQVDENCTPANVFAATWVISQQAPQMTISGCNGYQILTGQGQGLDGRLICTGPWTQLALVQNTNSVATAVSLLSGECIEFNAQADLQPVSWACNGPYPPGTGYGTLTLTMGAGAVTGQFVDNRMNGCNIRYCRP
jgi:hypothetical protein